MSCCQGQKSECELDPCCQGTPCTDGESYACRMIRKNHAWLILVHTFNVMYMCFVMGWMVGDTGDQMPFWTMIPAGIGLVSLIIDGVLRRRYVRQFVQQRNEQVAE